MSNNIGTIDLLEAGIRAEQFRQKAITSNIANMETPGYRRVDVQFEELLAKAVNSDGSIDMDKAQPEFHNPMETPVKANGNDVTLEAEVGQMVENSLRHKTYARILYKIYKQMELAIQTP